MTRLALLLLLTLAACTEAPRAAHPAEQPLVAQPAALSFPLAVYLPADAADWEVVEAQRVLSVWDDAVGEQVFELQLVDDLDATGCGFRWRWEDDLGVDGDGVEIVGYFSTALPECWSTLWVQRDTVGTTAAVHELGHGLGIAEHGADVEDVMHASLYPELDQHIMPYAVEHVRRLMGAL